VEPSPAEVAILPEPVASVPGAAEPAATAPSTPSSDSQPVSMVGGLAILVAGALVVVGGLAFRAGRRP
jgi:hypothetical protein